MHVVSCRYVSGLGIALTRAQWQIAFICFPLGRWAFFFFLGESKFLVCRTMTEADIRIERVRIEELVEFANRPEVMQGTVVPISRLRAIAHAANPCATPDDVALLLAMRGGECLAYVGFMPGEIRIDGQIHKIYWYSTWYARQDAEGAAAGGVLLHASLRLGLDLAATGLDPKSFEYYRRLRFKTIGPLHCFALDFDQLDPLGLPWRVLQILLRRRGRQSATLDAIFQTCRRFTKWVGYAIGNTAVTKATEDYELCELAELPADAVSTEKPPAVAFHRSVEVVRWAIRHPWITDRVEYSTPRFEFSDLREMVRFVVLEARRISTQEFLGNIVVSVCREKGITTVKILDHFLRCEDRYRVILAAALRYAKTYSADRIHIPEGCKPHLTQSLLLRWTFRPLERVYFCYPRRHHSVLGPVLDRITPQYCDGDTPFT